MWGTKHLTFLKGSPTPPPQTPQNGRCPTLKNKYLFKASNGQPRLVSTVSGRFAAGEIR
jgi:hypothetical protein